MASVPNTRSPEKSCRRYWRSIAPSASPPRPRSPSGCCATREPGIRSALLLAPEPDTRLTCAGLRSTARALAAELSTHGIEPGEVVSYMLPNGMAAASVFLGGMYGGYVVSPVSLLAQDALIEHTLAHSETRIVFAAPEFATRPSSIVARIGSRVIVRPTAPDDLTLSPGANA